TIFLSDHNIQPCEGCHYCESSGVCRIEDDIPALSAKMKAADVIILATPSHMGGVTSRMQALMERTWPLRKGQMAGKVGACIVIGRRQIGTEVGVLDAYFSRLRILRVPGVLGYAFEAGRIVEDKEAISQTARLADDIRRWLLVIRPKEGNT
ncbi:MAG TPA: flavodoxin family protein, partial [Planctomycetota bacterium]|nr:flavodoxin family protein [Planctomycetota bacterium]